MNLFAKLRPWPFGLMITLITVSVADASAGQMEWTGTQSPSWFIGTNWSPVGPPGGSDDVIIDTINPNSTVIGLAAANARSLRVGDTGTGQLTIQNGHTLNNTHAVFIGDQAGSEGVVVVTDAGTVWNNGSNVFVGASGEGHLTIENSAQVSNNQAFVGPFQGGMGTVTVADAGSVWDNAFDVWLGQSGTGTLTVFDGAAVTSPNGFLGLQAGGQGFATVSGIGSTWSMTQDLTVGLNGFGSMIISDQAMVSNHTGTLGDGVGAVGEMTVSGSGSTWTNASQIIVGDQGNGTLLIEEGGSVANPAGSNIAVEEGSQGSVTLTGTGSIWDNSGGFFGIGGRGMASLTVVAGALLQGEDAVIAVFSPANASALVSGPDSRWSLTGNLTVAQQSGTGLLMVENGATVEVGRNLRVGQSGQTDGTALVTGAGSLLTIVGNLLIGSHNNSIAYFAVDADAVVGVGGEVILAEVAFPGGCDCELRVDGLLSAVGGTVINEDSRLRGAGSIGGGTTTIAGNVAPGSPIGTLSTRNLTLEATATLEFELDEPGGVNDRLLVNDDLILDGTLQIDNLGGFDEGSYTLIQYSGSLTDNTLDVVNLPAGFNALVDTSVPGQVLLVVESIDELFQDRFEQ